MTFNFTETPNSSTKVIDTITLTTNDYLSFPTFFIRKHGFTSDNKPSLRMFFDSEKQVIAIAFVSSDGKGTYKINYSDKYGATCKIKSFMLNNDLDTAKLAKKYDYSVINSTDVSLEEGNVFIIELNNKQPEGGDSVES